MKAIILIGVVCVVFIGLTILAFSTVDGGESSPFVADANARATIDAARAAIESTNSAMKAAEIDQENRVLYMTAVAGDSQATATAVAVMFQSTATAAIESTASALSLRSTEAAIFAAATQSAADIRATEIARNFDNQARALRIERERRSNTVRAFFVYALIAAFSAGTLFSVVYLVVQLAKVKIVPRDSYAVIGKYLIDPSLAAGTVVDIENADFSVSPETAAKIKERAQIGDVLRAIPARATPTDIERLFGYGDNRDVKISNVEIIDPEVIGEWVDEVETKLLDDPE